MRPKEEPTDAKVQSTTFILSEKIDDPKSRKNEKEIKKELKRQEKEKLEREKKEKKAREKEKEKEKQGKKAVFLEEHAKVSDILVVPVTAAVGSARPALAQRGGSNPRPLM
ncbi:hypothetical protein EVAR_19851_1 [Eumeta japonica]|uniref:Uncharacterized protein n=1 Tax=Eumeta variegata TaxID=151549 RepID=A0A4C1US48_EUMVA|nr:hypothetical protein EVAR_19851_1 [Eumeta japonica]